MTLEDAIRILRPWKSDSEPQKQTHNQAGSCHVCGTKQNLTVIWDSQRLRMRVCATCRKTVREYTPREL